MCANSDNTLDTEDPYCNKCGSGQLFYLNRLENADQWKCEVCFNKFIWNDPRTSFINLFNHYQGMLS
jgi:hypothetical protein